MPKTLVEELMDEILGVINEQPMTMHTMAERLGANYYTVRKAVTRLVEDGKLKAYDRGRRNIRYTIGVDDGKRRIIPSLVWQNETISAPIFLHSETFTNHYGQNWVSIQGYLTRIFKLAERLHSGAPVQNIEADLRKIKAGLHVTQRSMDNLQFFLRQVLEENKLWDPVYLEKFPEDSQWNEHRERIQKAFDSYYNNEGTKD